MIGCRAWVSWLKPPVFFCQSYRKSLSPGTLPYFPEWLFIGCKHALQRAERFPRFDAMKKVRNMILQIVALIVFSTALAFIVNGFRTEGLPLVMPFAPEYQCPSRMTEGLAIEIEEALAQHGRGRALFVDARARESFEQGHIEGAINLPYSFLNPVPAAAVAGLRRSGHIIVYCNTRHDERSRLMAGELSDGGLKNVTYLEGGFLGWVKAQGSYTGQKPQEYE